MVTKTRPFYSDDRYFFRDFSPGQNPQIWQVGDYTYVADNFVELGDSNWDWKQIISTGGNATTPLVGVEKRKTCVPCSVEYGTKHRTNPDIYYRYQVWGNLFSYYLPVPSTYSSDPRYLEDADNQARTRFYSRLAETQSQFKGMVFSGELKESLELIRNPARSLRKGIGDYLDHVKKHGPRKAPRDRPKFVRDTWLEYSFGWKPLVGDLDSAVGAFLSSRWTQPLFKMVRARGRSGTQPIKQDLVELPAGGGSLTIQYYPEVEYGAEIKYYGIVRSSGTGPSSFRHYGFSPWEFVPTVWELIPYSFLVDYFTNIGDLVSAWSYRNIGVEWASKGHYEYVRHYIRNSKVVTKQPDDFVVAPVPGSLGSSVAEMSRKIRTPNSGVPLPSFRFEVPGMGTKWVNLLALTNQLGSTRKSLAS